MGQLVSAPVRATEPRPQRTLSSPHHQTPWHSRCRHLLCSTTIDQRPLTTRTMASQRPELPPPFIAVPGLPNLRDIGGQPVTWSSPGQQQDTQQAQQPGRKIIRRGIVYRSSEPSKVTEEGISILTERLGITHVYDLRSEVEIDRSRGKMLAGNWQPREWSGCQRVFVPVFLDQDYSPEALAARCAQYAHRSSEVGGCLIPYIFFPLSSFHRIIVCPEHCPVQPPLALPPHSTLGSPRDSLAGHLVPKHNRASSWPTPAS